MIKLIILLTLTLLMGCTIHQKQNRNLNQVRSVIIVSKTNMLVNGSCAYCALDLDSGNIGSFFAKCQMINVGDTVPCFYNDIDWE